MAIDTKSKLITQDGKYVQLPPYVGGQPDDAWGNVTLPNQFEEHSIQQYPLGTRLVSGERTYHYCKYGAACPRTVNAVFAYVDILEAAVNTYGAFLAGVTKIKVDGASAGSPAVNAWAGGYLLVLGSSQTYRGVMRIVSNKAADATSPYPVELTLEQPIPFDLSDDVNCVIYPNRYSDVRTMYSIGNGEYMTCVGWPARTISTANYFGWVQTWGPCFGNRAAEELTLAGDRDLVVAGDGALRAVDYIINSNQSFQRVGYSLATATAGGDLAGNGFFYMQIAP